MKNLLKVANILILIIAKLAQNTRLFYNWLQVKTGDAKWFIVFMIMVILFLLTATRANADILAPNHALGEKGDLIPLMTQMQATGLYTTLQGYPTSNWDFTNEAMNSCLADMQKYNASYDLLKSISFLWLQSAEFDVSPLMACAIMYQETKYGTVGSGTPPQYNPYGIGNNERPEYLGGYNGAHDRFVQLLATYYLPKFKNISGISRVYTPYSPIGADGMSNWERNVTNKYNQLRTQTQ